MIERLKQLQSERGKYANGAELSRALKTDTNLRNEVKILTKYFLKREVRGCSNCFFDAYMELIHFKFNKKEMEKVNSKFSLKKGMLISDGNSQKLLSNANCTDELAIYHLKRNPNLISKFERYPDNLDELLGAAKKSSGRQKKENYEKSEISENQTEINPEM